jgi:hypothetical protein
MGSFGGDVRFGQDLLRRARRFPTLSGIYTFLTLDVLSNLPNNPTPLFRCNL